jgi:hypothetical protein
VTSAANSIGIVRGETIMDSGIYDSPRMTISQ